MRSTAAVLWASLGVAGCLAGPTAPEPARPAPDVRVRRVDGMEVVRIPAGAFVAGDVQGFRDEPRPHTEHTGEFWIDRTEVTNAQFAAFLDAQSGDVSRFIDRSVLGLVREGVRWRAMRGRERHPCAAATFHGAEAYARWVGGRLPTDLEWEKAARGADGRTYPWGEALPDATRCNYGQTGLHDTAPVGSFPAGDSPFGVHDLAGNVYERVVTARGGGSIRSGSFVCPMGWQMRASDRCGYALDRSHASVGFRCVMDRAPE